MMLPTEKVLVQNISISQIHENGFDLADDDYSEEVVSRNEDCATALRVLTRKQTTIAALIGDGYSRKEIAVIQHVSLQAVHQIVLRMRKRLREKGGFNKCLI